MLKKLKQTTLSSLKATGAFAMIQSSKWRRARLLILGYHGISIDDEDCWNPSLYMPRQLFAERLSLIKKSGCTVLPLAEALPRLYAGDLPEKSVAITFDDGTFDFYRQAFPLLGDFAYPATLYLTTFYSQFNRPVFDVACPYVLWKGMGNRLNLGPVVGIDATFDLSLAAARDAAWKEIRQVVEAKKLSAEERDELLRMLAGKINVDYDEFSQKRILQLVRADEVKKLSAEGIDVQLHTHRHRTPQNRESFLREITDNQTSIREMTGRLASHFCYPSGASSPKFLPWLHEAGIESATTCELGLASRQSDPLLLPRLVDVSSLAAIEFESWLTGVSMALPRRR
ncbi:MAG TPA: polysaccharide deacetylase family protein [Pyrinomonadaceae bacterium]|jgi:peptidoglycan/xylan/chitin deacetylase (PgdA/CDA1 family)